jgi:hypothetical protein
LNSFLVVIVGGVGSFIGTAVGGVCPDCELFLWRYLKRQSAKSAVPGVWLRCSECDVSTYARPARSHIVQRDPPWVVDPEQVVEWFETNMVGAGAIAATDGGSQ